MSVLKPTRKSFSTEIVEFNSKKAKTSKPKEQIATNQTKTASFRRDKIPNQQKNDDKDEFLSLKQAKFDVFKYGIKGFSKEQQENANIQLAIKLGAAVSYYINIY